MPMTLQEALEALSECPVPVPPTPRPPFRYEMHVGVPGGHDEPLEQRWQPGDVIVIRAQEGIVNAPGGGGCAIWEARVVRPPHTVVSEPSQQESAAHCVPVPEPELLLKPVLALAACLLLFASYSRGRGRSSASRRRP